MATMPAELADMEIYDSIQTKLVSHYTSTLSLINCVDQSCNLITRFKPKQISNEISIFSIKINKVEIETGFSFIPTIPKI